MEVPHAETPEKVILQNRSSRPITVAKNAYIANFYNTSIDFVHREGDKSNQAARPNAAGPTNGLQSTASISTAGDGLINQPAGDVTTRPPPQPAEGGARKDLTTEAPATDPNCPQRTDRESTCDSRFSFVDFLEQSAGEGQRGTRADSGGGDAFCVVLHLRLRPILQLAIREDVFVVD